MRIGLYIEAATDDQPTGIGLHVRELVNALAEIDEDNEYLLYYPRALTGAARDFPQLPRRKNFRPRPVRFPRGWVWKRPTAWWKWYLPRVLRWDGIDVFHGPNHFVPAWVRRRTVVTFHDLAYFRMRVHGEEQDKALQAWTRRALAWSEWVIALSENTRRDLEELGVGSERIRVVYGGGRVVPESQIALGRVDELRRSLGLPKKFVLFVGALQPRKNVPFLLRAFAECKKRGEFLHKLVLAGPPGHAAAEIQELSRTLGIADDVIATGYVEEWQLPLLYKLAEAFVLPTLYEGFTLVTLEAMAYGTPVLATDTSSIREGVGDAALLVAPDDVAGLASALASVLTDRTLRTGLIERGKVQARKFTWDRCARETLQIYREVGEAAVNRPVAASSR